MTKDIKIIKLQVGTVTTFWCPRPAHILLYRIWIRVSWRFYVERNICDDFGFWWTLRTVILNNQVKVCLCFYSDTLHTHSGALIGKVFAEGLGADRIEGLVEAAASLCIQLFHPNKFSRTWFSAGILYAVLEICPSFFVEFRLWPPTILTFAALWFSSFLILLCWGTICQAEVQKKKHQKKAQKVPHFQSVSNHSYVC